MKLKATTLIATMFLCGHAAVSLAGDYDLLSGLPVVPNSFKTADPVQSYKYCGKNAQANAYYYSGSADSDGSAEDLVASATAWYRKAMPNAIVYTKSGVVFVKPDGVNRPKSDSAWIAKGLIQCGAHRGKLSICHERVAKVLPTRGLTADRAQLPPFLLQ